MEVLVLWAIGALLVAWWGSSTTLGFGSTFLISAIFSPLIGIIVVLLYPSKIHRDRQLSEQQKQTQLLSNLSQPKTSTADEIQKLKDQYDAGILTEDEFRQLKAKMINS